MIRTKISFSSEGALFMGYLKICLQNALNLNCGMLAVIKYLIPSSTELVKAKSQSIHVSCQLTSYFSDFCPMIFCTVSVTNCSSAVLQFMFVNPVSSPNYIDRSCVTCRDDKNWFRFDTILLFEIHLLQLSRQLLSFLFYSLWRHFSLLLLFFSFSVSCSYYLGGSSNG